MSLLLDVFPRIMSGSKKTLKSLSSLNEPLSLRFEPSTGSNLKVPDIFLSGLSGSHHLPSYSDFSIVLITSIAILLSSFLIQFLI